ncbi:MAG: YraN family protein [Gammaproteobacteria bacterium]
MKSSRTETPQELGRRAEALAESHLQHHGLKTLARNHRFARGEIDIVMLDGSTVVFVEVRYRKRSDYGSASESVFDIKQRRLIMAAQHFLQAQSKYSNLPCRFDVAIVSAAADGTLQEGAAVEWIRDAFQA